MVLKQAIAEYVNLLIEARMREADVSSGARVPWGSEDHITDLENRIRELTKWRDKQRRGTEARANYARMINMLKNELRSARRKLDQAKLSESVLMEGGAVGHLMHLYDNPELTFAEIKDILSDAAAGRLEKVSEKLDGMNLVVSWDIEASDLRAARNSGDIKGGGMDASAVSARFQDRGNVGEAFTTAFKVLKDAFGSLPVATLKKIFGPRANIWYSAEIIYSQNPNVISYDSNNIVFHGWPVFEYKGGEITRKENAPGVDILQKNVERMQNAVTVRNWRVRGPVVLRLQGISDGSISQRAIGEIDSAMSAAGVSDVDTVGDYLYSLMSEKVANLDLPEEAATAVTERSLGLENAPSLIEIKRMLPKDQHIVVSNFVKSAPGLLKSFIQPLEDAIHVFAIEVLRGLHSTLIDDSDAEVMRLRAEVATAVKAIESSGQETAMEILKRQMQKLGKIENIAAAMEGVVFIYKGNAYKFTGAFAPANQILGLFKYGRGGVKINATGK